MYTYVSIEIYKKLKIFFSRLENGFFIGTPNEKEQHNLKLKGGGEMPKSKGGRPPKYKSKEEIEKLIENYFRECEGIPFFDDSGKPLRTSKGYIVYEKFPKPPTVSGLAYALGFASRQALINYQGKREFNDTITRAKLYIETHTEERLFDRDGVQGAKFSLINNFKGWSEHPKEDAEKATLEKLDEILEGINNAAKP